MVRNLKSGLRQSLKPSLAGGLGDGDIFTTASLDLNFAKYKNLGPVDATTGSNLVTFSRASSGTYVGSDGLIKTATTNEPRFDHDPTTGESLGLLVQEQRVNYLINSESFTGWTVAGNGLTQSTASAIAAPNGQLGSVQLFTEDLTTGVHRIFIAPSTGQLTQTHSVFVKAAAGTRKIYLSSDNPSGARRIISFDLQTGTIFLAEPDWTGVFITPYPNGWYRIGGTITDNGGTTLFIIGFDNGVSGSYAGDGTSGIYLWGAQLEAGAFPTSYIPTAGATVTRAADVASISGTNFSSWYRQDEGTVFQLYSHIGAVGSNNGLFNMHKTSSPATDRHTIRAGNYAITVGNVTQASASYGIPAAGALAGIAYAYKADDIALFRPVEKTILTDNSATIPLDVNTFELGKIEGTSLQINGHIRRLTYWPARLPNSTLQAIAQ